MKKVIFIFILGLAGLSVILINFFGMRMSGAFEQDIPVERLEVSTTDPQSESQGIQPDGTYVASVKYMIAPGSVDNYLIVDWEVFPSNASNKSVEFRLQGVGNPDDVAREPGTGIFHLVNPPLFFVIDVFTTGGLSKYARLEVMTIKLRD